MLLRCQRHVRSSSLWPSARGVATTAEFLKLKRGDFARIGSDDLEYFSSILPHTSVVTDQETIEPYNTEWTHTYKGQSQLLLKPSSTAQISQILAYCSDRRLAVVPVGGRTGLVGGALSVFDEILLSLEKMNSVRTFDQTSGVLVADAGVILQDADDFLEKRGHLFPLDLGSKGSCQIGGNVSTNAGGIRFLKYGSLHGSVLGVEAVLADGTVVDALSTMRKDNSGYDLKQLFIGSEGTLGVVTGISIACPAKPSSVQVAFLSVQSFEDVQRLYALAKEHLAEILGSFEAMDRIGLDLVATKLDLQRPFEAFSPFSVLIETRGSNEEHDLEKLNEFFSLITDQGYLSDGVIAQSEKEKEGIWKWREEIPNVSAMDGGFYSYDVSLPLHVMFDLVNDINFLLEEAGLSGNSSEQPVIATTGFGHIGDGNLHVLIPVRRYDARVVEVLEPYVFEWVARQKGSISAEHGIGIQKRSKKKYSRSPEQISLMRLIKAQLDPKGILNPYKYFAESE